MGVRLTGISTPVGGVSWEYTKGAERSAPLSIFPRQKIQVFISSICGVEKYDKVRDELKTAIERTQLADVYTFESKEASTLPAGNHYTWALEDSDICIRFLYNGIIIKHQKTEPTYTKTSLFLCEKRRFFMARREKGVVPIIYFEKERGKSF